MCRLPPNFDHYYPHEFSTCSDACRQPWRKYLYPAQPEGEKLAMTKQGLTEHTMKTRRILLRFNLQVAMVSLSFLAWKIREALCRLLFLMIFICISAIVLR